MQSDNNKWMVTAALYFVLGVLSVWSLTQIQSEDVGDIASIEKASFLQDAEWTGPVVWVGKLMIRFIEIVSYMF